MLLRHGVEIDIVKLERDKIAYALRIVFVTVFVFSGTAWGNINIEALVITGWEYNSNFWRSETDEAAVDTFFLKPGITLGYDTAKSKVEAGFILESYWYNDREAPPTGVQDASDDDYVGYTGHFLGETQVTQRLTLMLSDSLFRTRDAANSDIYSNSISRDLYTINYFSPGLYYDFGNKFDLRLKYRNIITDYSEGTTESSKDNGGVADLLYNFNSRSSVFLSYNMWERDYDGTTSTYLSNKLTLNYTRQFHYFSLDVGGGYHHRSFDQTGLDSFDLFAWHIIVDGQKPPAPARKPKGHMKLALRQDYNDAGIDNQYYIATQLDAELGYLLMAKIQTIFKVYYQNSDYQNDPQDRNDDTYLVSGSVSYRFWDHGKVTLEFGYKERQSSLTGNDYEDTFSMLSFDFDYDFGNK